jgi:DNA polymerase-3 subunit epsilon
MIALFFDTETNGIKTWQNPDFQLKLVQLGAILQDTETKRVYAEINLINKQVGDIPVGASNVHGITPDIAQRFGVYKSLIDETFASLIRTADILVAHNLDYDMDVLKDYMPESFQSATGKLGFCTMDSNVMIVKAPLSEKQKAYFSSKGRKPDAPYKVPSLIETYTHYFNKPFEGAHDAMADIRACRDVYFAMDIKQEL